MVNLSGIHNVFVYKEPPNSQYFETFLVSLVSLGQPGLQYNRSQEPAIFENGVRDMIKSITTPTEEYFFQRVYYTEGLTLA